MNQDIILKTGMNHIVIHIDNRKAFSRIFWICFAVCSYGVFGCAITNFISRVTPSDVAWLIKRNSVDYGEVDVVS